LLQVLRGRSRYPHQHGPVALAKRQDHGMPFSKRARTTQRDQRLPFVPPEDWYEPTNRSSGYRVVLQAPGKGYRHPVTPAEVRARLDALPPAFVAPLEVIQFSRMTRKKQSFPCYGMQWGASLYLYPIEENLVEYYDKPPKPSQRIEARMYGGRWLQDRHNVWKLVWTEQAIKDFYLNNILIHELGHLLDDRNVRSVDRERYAEWFALRHGYASSQRRSKPAKKLIRRRHHSRA
jgi:hypothetical protein